MARSWRDVRAEAVASGRVDPARVDAARKAMSRSRGQMMVKYLSALKYLLLAVAGAFIVLAGEGLWVLFGLLLMSLCGFITGWKVMEIHNDHS